MKAVVAAFNQEKALVGAFSVLTNLRMELFQALVRTLYFSPSPSARTGAIMESELSSISYSGMSAGLISMQRQTVTINVQVFKGTNLIHDDHECIQLIIQWMNSETFFRIQIFLVFLSGWMKRHFSGYILLGEVNIYLKLFFPHPTHKILTPLIDDDAINVSWNFV